MMMNDDRKYSGNDTGESFADLFKDANKSHQKGRLTRGQKVEATVVGIAAEFIFLDVGAKSEGYIAREELADEEGNPKVAVGDKIKVFFLSAEKGEKLFTTRLGGGSVSAAHLEAAFEKSVPVEGLVIKEIKGGFEIRLAGNVRAFCPYSQMGLYRIENTDEYINQKYNFNIMEFTDKGRNIVVSHRAFLEAERQQQREELRASLQEGMTVKGRITSIREFGAFADIGGVDGLIPISEIGWSRIEDINEILHVGQEVEVVIISLDWEKDRIALSLKQALADPWSTAEMKYAPQSLHQGTISRLTKFGAFVTLEPGIDGLLHISKLGAGRKINHPKEVVGEGQLVEVRVESVDKDQRRISLDLGANATEAEEKTDEEYKEYVQTSHASASSALGSFGEILQEKLKEKKSE
jgi:small subunit ribosomal protein S1